MRGGERKKIHVDLTVIYLLFLTSYDSRERKKKAKEIHTQLHQPQTEPLSNTILVLTEI